MHGLSPPQIWGTVPPDPPIGLRPWGPEEAIPIISQRQVLFESSRLNNSGATSSSSSSSSSHYHHHHHHHLHHHHHHHLYRSHFNSLHYCKYLLLPRPIKINDCRPMFAALPCSPRTVTSSELDHAGEPLIILLGSRPLAFPPLPSVHLLSLGASIPPKSIMHIVYSPYFHKIYVFCLIYV